MEYKEDKLTAWFDINECKPLEKGAYVVKDNYGFIMASIWNGEYFQSCSGLIDDGVLTAKESVEQISHQTFFSHDETMFPITHWRGLNFNPQSPQKLAKKKGNKNVTRWMHITGMMGSELIHKVHGVYKTKREAEAARDKRNSKGWRSSIRRIRFRTPEA